MKKLLIVFILSIISIFAGEKNIGFLTNQKYLCINQGAFINNKIVPILSKEDTLKYPLRIKVDDNNLLQTDGAYKNLKHIEKTLYANSNTKIMLMIEKDKRFMMLSSKKMNNMPILYLCTETDNWTLTK